MELHKLRYRISDWRQAPKCLSNTSRKLHIEIAEFVQNEDIRGLRLSVRHELFGELFVTTIRCVGNLLDEDVPELSTQDILQQLARFGFLIEYVPEAALSGPQLDCLANLQELGYDKITRVYVTSRPDGKLKKECYIVAFIAAKNTELMSYLYTLTQQAMTRRMNAGTIVNITDVSYEKQFDWTWLEATVNIEDILNANSVVEPTNAVPDVDIDIPDIPRAPVIESADLGDCLVGTDNFHIFGEEEEEDDAD